MSVDFSTHLVAANVASVPNYSPFRYPGGKTWLALIVRQWLEKSGSTTIYEPFAGGASTSLLAVIEGYVKKSVLIELDNSVAAVWKTIFSEEVSWLTSEIANFELTPENVADLLSREEKSNKLLALQTLVKNRCRRGGVLTGGAGLLQKGERGNGISSRWYPDTLCNRINKINELRGLFSFFEGDAMSALPDLLKDESAVFFIDPPYTKLMGRGVKPLYSHFNLDHERLFEYLHESRVNFLMTYDDSLIVRQLARRFGFVCQEISMRNLNSKKKIELLIHRGSFGLLE